MQHRQNFTRRILTTVLLALSFGARAAGAGSISVHWDPSGEPDVAGYRVYIGMVPGVHSSSVDVGNTTSYVFNNALAGQKYCFAVAAYTPGPRLGDKSVEVCSNGGGNNPPTLTNPGNQISAVGAALTLTLDGSDPDDTPVTFSATGLPTGLTLNTNTGFISGTPTTVGTFNTKATVSDGSASTTQAFTWTISASLPGAASPLRPTGAIATAAPTFEWESVTTATSYRLWVDDASTTDPKVQIDVTPAQAGCTTAGAVCHVSPGVLLAGGRASWSVRASNASGPGPWSGAMDFTVPDTKAPTVSIATPTAAATHSTSAATMTLGGTATDDGAVSLVTWTNNLGGSGSAAGTTAWTVAALPLKIGTNVITVTARDAGGNTATDVLTVTKTDGQGPTLTIQSPTASTSYSTTAATLAIGGSASDDAAVTQVTWVSDRGGSGTAAGTTAWSVAVVALKPGANVIAVTAHDGAGNKTTKTLTATVADGQAPTVTISSPAAATTHTTGDESVSLGGTASDAVGVTQVTSISDRGPHGTASGTTAWSVPTVVLRPGANVITVTARDAAGNTGTDSITVTMTDGGAPVVAIAAPTAAAAYTTTNASIALGGTASDDFGVTQVTWASDKGGTGSATGTTSWSASVVLEVGVNVITVTAKDATGRVGSDVITVTRTDGVLPTIAIATPAAGSTFSTTNTTIALSGTASDNVGVAQVSWTNNKGGSGVATGTTAWSVGSLTLQPGANVITVTVKDAAGNSATDVLTVTLTDAVAPTVSIVTPTRTAAYSTSENTIALGGQANDDVALAAVTWSNSQGGSGAAVGTSAWSVAGIALKTGLNTLTVTARDTAGNTTAATLVVRVSDVKAPTVRITAPSADPAFSIGVGVVNLEGVSADDFGVARVTWVSDRGLSGVATVGADRWIAGGLALQPGVNVVTVTAVDGAGNASTDVARITYERGAPTISLTSPTTSTSYTTSSSSVTLTGAASDDSGVARVTWSTDKGQAGDAAGTTSWTIPAITVPLGTTVVTVTAHDNSGNTSNLTLSIVNADTVKPTVKIYTPTTAGSVTTSGSTVTLAGTATDNVGITQVTWASNRGATGTAYGTASWSTGGIALEAGTTSVITVTARDAAGNSGVAVFTATAKAASTTNPTPDTNTTSPAPDAGPPAAAPVVRILTPTPAHRYNTINASVSLSGVSSHASGISMVRWMTDKGESGVAGGASNWTIAAIPAKPGRTVVTVTAVAASGAVASDVLTVIRPNPLPKLSLSYPAADSQWTSGTATVALKGIATDNVTRVLWSSDSGATGVATGTTAWAIAGIGLQEGVNRITLTAQDASGRTDRQVLKITYRPGTGLSAGAAKSASAVTAGLE